MHRGKIKNGSNVANWMVLRNRLIKAEGIEKLSLVVIEPAPSSIASIANRIRATESPFPEVANDFCNMG
jgi:hypothetical protein